MSGATVNRWRLGCVDLYVGQEVGLRQGRGNKKEPRRFRPLSCLMRSLAFKETASELRAGVSPQTAKLQHELVLIGQGCQGQSEDSFVQKKGAGPRKLALPTHAAEVWQPILMSTATVIYFDAIFGELMGTPEI